MCMHAFLYALAKLSLCPPRLTFFVPAPLCQQRQAAPPSWLLGLCDGVRSPVAGAEGADKTEERRQCLLPSPISGDCLTRVPFILAPPHLKLFAGTFLRLFL